MIIEDYKINNILSEVGVIDNRDVPFHRLTLEKGTTYNSYFYNTEKKTIIDTVDMMYTKDYLDNLAQKIDLETLAYIVINHTEPDHSGAVGGLARKAKNAKIVCTQKAVYHLTQLYKIPEERFIVVKMGDTLDIGGTVLSFYPVEHLHTEETMITFSEADSVLFSCDIFSTHIATQEALESKADIDITEDYKVYYDLIMSPHKMYVRPMIRIVKSLPIKMICTSHGYILDRNLDTFIGIYDDKSKAFTKSHAVAIVFTSMRGQTTKIAKAFAHELNKNPLTPATMYNADKVDHKEILEAIDKADVVLFGSSTKYGDMFGTLEDILKTMPSLHGKIALAFGAFGWSGEGVEIIQDYLLKTEAQVLTSSEYYKSNGAINCEFPFRVRFIFNDADEEKVKDSVLYINSLLE